MRYIHFERYDSDINTVDPHFFSQQLLSPRGLFFSNAIRELLFAENPNVQEFGIDSHYFKVKILESLFPLMMLN